MESNEIGNLPDCIGVQCSISDGYVHGKFICVCSCKIGTKCTYGHPVMRVKKKQVRPAHVADKR